MSLGFLTESALLPSKSKAIKVDSKSVLDLKAIVYEKEQELKKKSSSSSATSRYKRGRSSTGGGGNSSRRAEKREKLNKGIDARIKRDEDVYLDDSEKAKLKRSAEILEKKAQLYDQLARGEIDPSMNPHILIDFKKKPKEEEELVEIIDEFGRTRRVKRSAMVKPPPEVVQTAAEEHDSSSIVGPRDGHVSSQWEKTLKGDEKKYLQEMSLETKRARDSIAEKKKKKTLRLEKLRAKQYATAFLDSITH